MENSEILHDLSHIGHYLHARRKGRPAQERILHIISHHKIISQKELMDILHLSQGSVSELIRKLESRGLIQREKDPEDNRRFLLSLTEEGKKQEKLLRLKSDEEDDPLLDCLNEKEKESLHFLLNKILKSWEGERK